MNKLLKIILLFCFLTSFAQQNKITKGQIIDTVFVDKNIGESFSLYLPNQYDPNILSPIVFIFDPMARGKAGIHPFIKSSEKYGYILVCSNNAKNGPYDQNFQITDRLFKMVFLNFKIDENRIYTSGFSGGSRLASTIAIITKQIQGVVACGAGFSSNSGIIPSTETFSYAGIVGNQDMNYIEMHNTKGFLNKINLSNELFVFDMNHRWPSQKQILKAFDWLQLEAYKKNIIPENKDDIKKIYFSYYSDAVNFENENNVLSAAEVYERIIRNFQKYYQLDSINEKLTHLRKNEQYKNEITLLASNFKEEEILSKKFIDQFNKDFNRRNYNSKWWKSEIFKLKKKIENGDTNRKNMLNRVQYKVFAHAIETASHGNNIRKTSQSIFCYDICILIYPKYPLPYFKQIENSMVLQNEKLALSYLEKLLNSGYSDINRINKIKGIDKLKNNDTFIELINK